MALDDVGLNPMRLAAAIHKQLGNSSGPVPVKEIALGLDIHEIREERLTTIEAALVTAPERDYGSIVVNTNSSPQRRRFSIGHELLHFLNPLHVQTSDDGFSCTSSDMVAGVLDDPDRHKRQEAEANAFSIELLTPRDRLRPYLTTSPNLKEILRLASDFDISREAAARRYVELHSETLAVAFCANATFIYASRSRAFPAFCLRKAQPVVLVGEGRVGDLSLIEDVDAADWVYKSENTRLVAQTLYQQNGFSTTLLHMMEPEDDDGLDDT